MAFGDLITFISIVVTIVVVWKLYGVLGQRTGHQAPPPNVSRRQQSNKQGNNMSGESKSDNVLELPTGKQRKPVDNSADNFPEEILRKHADPGSKLYDGLKSVMMADRNFNPDEFINGAKMAYEMIVTAFADGDTKALKGLLSKDVYDGFAEAIANRQAEGQRVEFSFVGIDECKLVDGETVGNDVFVTVRFVSQIISATLDAEGEVIDGDKSEITDVSDVWTFNRDARSRDPNWKLVATEAES